MQKKREPGNVMRRPEASAPLGSSALNLHRSGGNPTTLRVSKAVPSNGAAQSADQTMR